MTDRIQAWIRTVDFDCRERCMFQTERNEEEKKLPAKVSMQMLLCRQIEGMLSHHRISVHA